MFLFQLQSMSLAIDLCETVSADGWCGVSWGNKPLMGYSVYLALMVALHLALTCFVIFNVLS